MRIEKIDPDGKGRDMIPISVRLLRSNRTAASYSPNLAIGATNEKVTQSEFRCGRRAAVVRKAATRPCTLIKWTETRLTFGCIPMGAVRAKKRPTGAVTGSWSVERHERPGTQFPTLAELFLYPSAIIARTIRCFAR